MRCVGFYNRIRRGCHVDGMSKSAAGRLCGIDRKTVAKILRHSVPPGSLPKAQVETTDPASYKVLMPGAAA